MRRALRYALPSLLTASLFTPAWAQRRVELNDLGRQVNIAGPRLSPDGRSALVVLVRTNYPDNRFERSLNIVDLDRERSQPDAEPAQRGRGGMVARWGGRLVPRS